MVVRIVLSLIIGILIGTMCSSYYTYTKVVDDPVWNPPVEERTQLLTEQEKLFPLTEEELRSIIYEDDPLRAEAAIRTLGFRETDVAHTILETVISDETLSDRLRGQAALSLARGTVTDVPDSIQGVLRTDADPEGYLPNAATEAIGHMGIQESQPILEQQLEWSTAILKISSHNALERIEENDQTSWEQEGYISYESFLDTFMDTFRERFRGDKEELTLMVAGFLLMPKGIACPLSQEVEQELARELTEQTYQVITTHKIQEILEINAYQQSDFFEDSVKVNIGRLLRSNTLITGTFTPILERDIPFLRVRIEIIDIESGLISSAWGYNIQWENFLAQRLALDE